MADGSPRRMNETAARAQFDQALAGHEQAFETFFLARLLGLEFEYLPTEAPDPEKTLCRLTFPVTEMLKNPQGSLHGGAMASAMDISMGHLVNKVAGPGATIEMKIQYMRPVMDGTVTCEGSFTKRGRSLSFMESKLYTDDGKLAAHATATWKMP
ncbi:MAG: PaaI family thioesterase [Pseudomonadota bacterium]